MKIVLFFCFLLLFVFIILKSNLFKYYNVPKKHILLLFVLKIALSGCFYYVYTFYYPDRSVSDMYRYFDDAVVIHNARYELPDYLSMLTGIGDNTEHIAKEYYRNMNNWYASFESFMFNDNRTMIRLNALFMLVSLKSIFIHSLIFLFLAMTGLILLVKSLGSGNKQKDKLLFYIVLLFPSLGFWTGSVTKEALLVFALGGFMFFYKKLTERQYGLKNIVAVILFFLLLLHIKTYFLLVLFPFLFVRLFMKYKFKNSRNILIFSAALTSYLLIIWNIHYVFPEYNFVEAFVRKQTDFINYARFIGAGSMIDMPYLDNNVLSFLKALPGAYLNVLFRPYIWETSNFLMFGSALENMLVFSLFLVVLIFPAKRQQYQIDFWMCLFICLFFFALVGIATPVLGAIVRYKVAAYPFLFYIILQLIDIEKLKQFSKTKL